MALVRGHCPGAIPWLPAWVGAAQQSCGGWGSRLLQGRPLGVWQPEGAEGAVSEVKSAFKRSSGCCPRGRSGLSGGKTGPRIAAELTGQAAGHTPAREGGACTCPCPSCFCLATRELVEATGHSGSAAVSSGPTLTCVELPSSAWAPVCTCVPPRQGAGPLPPPQERGHVESPQAPGPGSLPAAD